jgi:hypothetical protein
MELKQFATTLANAIWEREQRSHRSVDSAMLGYVQDAVAAQLEYRRRMQELDRRIVFLDEPGEAAADH